MPTNEHPSSSIMSCSLPYDDASHQKHDIADIVIVGAGIIGCAAALRFAQKGLKVHVIDAHPIGRGASYGNAGHIATEQVFPPASPAILRSLPRMLLDPTGPLRVDWRYLPKITPWLVRLMLNMRPTPYRQSVNALSVLNQYSLSAWQRLLKSIGEEALLECHGNLTVYEKAENKCVVDELYQRMTQEGISVQTLTRHQLLEREPSLDQHLMGGLEFLDTAHVVNPHRVVKTLAAAAQAHGTRFTQYRVTHATVRHEGVQLSTQDQTINARRVLIACGAHSSALVKQLTGQRVPLDTERGYHLMLPCETHRLHMPVNSLERSFIMTMENGLRLAGTVEFAGLNQPPQMSRAWQLQHHANALFDKPLNISEAEPWMGFRPSLPDALPVIDSLLDGRVLLAFGHQHLGLTQAAITADLLSNLIPEKKATHETGTFGKAIDLTPYRLARFF